MGSQPGIVLYHAEYKNVRDILSQSQKGDLLDALMTFGETGEIYTGDDPLVNMAFNIHASAIRRTEEKYNNRCLRNAENIRKRWEKQKTASDTIEYDRIPTDTTGYKQGETKTKTETKTEKKRNIFIPPTVEQVAEYCRERGNGIDPEAFVSYYERQGWELSNGRKMKDWRATVVTWEKNKKEAWNGGLQRNRSENRIQGQRELYGL